MIIENETDKPENFIYDGAEKEIEKSVAISEKCSEEHLEESEENLTENNKMEIENTEGTECTEKCIKKQLDIIVDKISSETENPVKNSAKNCKNENYSCEIADCKKTETADKPLHNSTGDLNCCLEIGSDQSNLDDRIQALSMQIKDVRIRRDSDRQENLLNSSESVDDWESQKTNCTSPKSSIEDSSIENGDNWSHAMSEEQTKDWISKTLTTLKPRHHVSPLECSINSCLSHFTKPELLTGNNKFRCENCTQLKVKKTGNLFIYYYYYILLLFNCFFSLSLSYFYTSKLDFNVRVSVFQVYSVFPYFLFITSGFTGFITVFKFSMII